MKGREGREKRGDVKYSAEKRYRLYDADGKGGVQR